MLEETLAELQGAGVKAAALIADVADLSAYDRMLDEAEHALGLAFCTGQVLHADGGLVIPRF
jgi:hypothetical protein